MVSYTPMMGLVKEALGSALDTAVQQEPIHWTTTCHTELSVCGDGALLNVA
jgi:hypothetical protein